MAETHSLSRRHPAGVAPMPGATLPTARDRVRQIANLLGAAAQISATIWVVSSGASEGFTGADPGGDPPIIPAGYAFSIWGPIYAGALAYAVVQALPANGAREDFRRAGWGSAVAFLATAVWLLLAVRPALIWWTVAVFAVIGLGLARALAALDTAARKGGPRPRYERWLVRAPISVFLGWTSVAIFANSAAALRATGMTRPGGETGISLALLAVGTAIAVATTRWTRGNGWYVGTVLWALVGIIVADVTGARGATNLPVASGAAVAAVVVSLTLLATRRAPRA